MTSFKNNHDDRFVLDEYEIDATPKVSNQRRGLSSSLLAFDPQLGRNCASSSVAGTDLYQERIASIVRLPPNTTTTTMTNDDRTRDRLTLSSRSDRTEQLRSESRRSKDRSTSSQNQRRGKSKDDKALRRRKSSDGTERGSDLSDLVQSIRKMKKSTRSKSMDMTLDDDDGGGGGGAMIEDFPTSVLKKPKAESKNVKHTSKSSKSISPLRRRSRTEKLKVDHDDDGGGAAAAVPSTVLAEPQKARHSDAEEIKKKPPPEATAKKSVSSINKSVSLYEGIFGNDPDPLEERLQARRSSMTPRRASINDDGGATGISPGTAAAAATTTTTLSKIEAYIVSHHEVIQQPTSREKSSSKSRKSSKSPLRSSKQCRQSVEWSSAANASSLEKANTSTVQRRSSDPIDASFQSFLTKYNSRVTDPTGNIDESHHSNGNKKQGDFKRGDVKSSKRRSKSVDVMETFEKKRNSSGKSKKNNREDFMSDIVSIDLRDLLESAMMMETAEAPPARRPMRSSSFIDAFETEEKAQVKEFSRASRNISMYVDAKDKHMTLERAAKSRLADSISRLDQEYISRETSSFMESFTRNMDESDRAESFQNGRAT